MRKIGRTIMRIFVDEAGKVKHPNQMSMFPYIVWLKLKQIYGVVLDEAEVKEHLEHLVALGYLKCDVVEVSGYDNEIFERRDYSFTYHGRQQFGLP